MTFAAVLGWTYTPELGAMMVANGCASSAGLAEEIYTWRVKEWRGLKIFFVFGIVYLVGSLVNTAIFFEIMSWGAIFNLVVLIPWILLLLVCYVKQEQKK